MQTRAREKIHSNNMARCVKKLSPVVRASEGDLLKACKDALNLLKEKGVLNYRRIHVMPVMRSSKRFSANSDMSGMEDLQIYLPLGKTWFVELKRHKGVQSDLQMAREEELTRLGHDYSVVRSVESLLDGLKERGIFLAELFMLY